MKRIALFTVGALALAVVPTAVAAQQQNTQVITPAVPQGFAYRQPLAYPSAGQGATQQATDVSQCHTFASQHMGFDPRRPHESAAAVAQQLQTPQDDELVDGSAVKGAARGAAAGALIGWATGNAGRGAAIGAASGGILGRAGRRQRKQAEQAAAEQAARAFEQAQYEAFLYLVDEYDEAWVLCMGARDYAVNR
jgi:uncharacterized protein YcfJ